MCFFFGGEEAGVASESPEESERSKNRETRFRRVARMFMETPAAPKRLRYVYARRHGAVKGQACPSSGPLGAYERKHSPPAAVSHGVAVTTRTTRGAAVALAIVLTSALPGAPDTTDGSDPVARIRAEIASLRQSLEEKPIEGPGTEGLAPAINGALDASANALDAGRVYLSLQALQRAESFIHGARFSAEKEAAVASGLPAFESEWAEVSRALEAGDRAPGDGHWRQSRAAIRALAEVSEGRIEPLLEGARGFAVATGPKDGLLYMGQARGEAAFAALCAGLAFDTKVEPYPLRSMLPELLRLRDKATAAFVPPRSVDLHDRFIALNSSVKAGLDLDASESYAGSAYQYLEGVRHYGMLDAPPLDEPAQARVQEDLAAARARIDASKRDESLAQIFLERAASQVAHADGSAPTVDEWRSARVILDQVLPAYFAAPVAAPKATSEKTVRMTLLRWAYT